MKSIAQRIAEELCVAERQVVAAVELIDGGATVPFIARYRKEATGALDDTQLRTLEERLRYLRELEDRRKGLCHVAGATSAKCQRLMDGQAAATAVRHVVIATPRSARCVWAEMRWRWTWL